MTESRDCESRGSGGATPGFSPLAPLSTAYAINDKCSVIKSAFMAYYILSKCRETFCAFTSAVHKKYTFVLLKICTSEVLLNLKTFSLHCVWFHK